MCRDWSYLPADALEHISRLLPNDADYVRFRSVCCSWRSAAPKRPLLPWLLTLVGNEHSADSLRLWNVPKTEFLSISQEPEGIARGKLIVGLSHGWFFLFDEAPKISLYNPFTGVHLLLPRIQDFPPRGVQVRKSNRGFEVYGSDGQTTMVCTFSAAANYFASGVILSSDPVTALEDCVIMAICNFSTCLMYCRPRDPSWTLISPILDGRFDSIIFYQGRFYAVSRNRLFICNVDDARAMEISTAGPNQLSWDRPSKSYLVESSGELLLAVNLRDSHRGPDMFTWEIFRVDLGVGTQRLHKLTNLGGRSLFIDAMFMPVSVAGSICCRGNTIYYLTKVNTKQVIHVFRVEDGTTTLIDLMDGCRGACWLKPSLGY